MRFENLMKVVVDVNSISSYECDNREENRKDTSVKKIPVVKKDRGKAKTIIICVAWVDLNTVQYMTTMHTIDEMKEITLERSERCHEIFKSAKTENRLPFSIPIVEYKRPFGMSTSSQICFILIER
jgi:hypothetical protein